MNATCTTQTAEKYADNLAFNLNRATEERRRIVEYIAETTREIASTDGRKKSLLETLNKRLEMAQREVARLEGVIHTIDGLDSHVEEVACIDDEISALCARKNALLGANQINHCYLRSKSYGHI